MAYLPTKKGLCSPIINHRFVLPFSIDSNGKSYILSQPALTETGSEGLIS